MDIHNEYIAEEKDIVFYAGKPVLNRQHKFYDVNGDPWSFSLATGFSFKIWQEREGGLLMIEWYSDTYNLANSENIIFLNAPGEDTDIELGKYYYEIEYTVSGGYGVLIAFGEAKFI